MPARSIAVAHLRPGDEIVRGGRLVPTGIVREVESSIGEFPASIRLETNDPYLDHTNGAFRVVYEDGSTSQWVGGSRHVSATTKQT